ncbi:MAG TPA: type VI secretion system baseplate subunit TssG [Herpetosiphonaceae bacterium]
MATAGWWSDSAVAEALHAEGPRFDFYQAVRLLELLHPATTPVGDGIRPDREAVRFQSTVAQAFTGTDIAAVEPAADEHDQALMRVNFLGLAGALGPLPAPYTRLLLTRLDDGDPATRDFLDIFNHRLISLMYRVRKNHRAGFGGEAPGDDRVAGYLFALLGLGTDGLRDRQAIPDVALLRYAGLFAQQPRSAAGLACLLRDYFKVGVEVGQFCGRWVRLDEDQWTAIGESGRNQALGRGALLGQRIYDVQGRLELRLGPLDLREYLDFLPIGHGFRSLSALARFYLQETLDFDVRLTLRSADVPRFRLGSAEGARLGWTTFLTTQPAQTAPELRLCTIG